MHAHIIVLPLQAAEAGHQKEGLVGAVFQQFKRLFCFAGGNQLPVFLSFSVCS
jgi:hypothetical protein